jgi:uncharacterized phage protein (TIGR02218 family)
MSKTISPALKAHMAQTVTTLAMCWEIVRVDSASFAFTTLDVDLTISGVTYRSIGGFSSTAIVTGSTGQVDNLEVIGFFDEAGIVEQDLKNGLFNYATIYLFLVNWADLSMGICRMRRGWLGETIRMPNGQFHAELRGLTQGLVQEFGNVFTPICRADLGDSKCTIPITSAPLRQTGTVAAAVNQHAFISAPLSYPAGQLGNVAIISIRDNVSHGTALEISDGVNTPLPIFFPFDTTGAGAFTQIMTALGTSGLDISFSGVGDNITITNNSGKQGNIVKTGDIALPPAFVIENFTGAYLDGGTITWITGSNAGVSIELKTYDTNTSTVVLWLGANFPIAPGDTFYYSPGCDKTRETCFKKFNNILNFRGEPDMPGLDQALSYPESN